MKAMPCLHPRLRAGRLGRSAFSALLSIAMIAVLLTAVSAVPAHAAPNGPDFHLNAADLRYILTQIQISENHAAQTRVPGNAPNCSVLVGTGPFQIPDPRLPYGLRTVDGTCNNLVAGQESFASSGRTLPRLTTPVFRSAEQGTSFTQNTGTVIDSRPRTISNLIVDQTATNPAAVAAAGPAPVVDNASGTLFIPNLTPDAALSQQFTAAFTFFGQFFDHGLTLLRKGGNGQVFVPLQADDNLFVPGSQTNFMVLTRATNLPGPDGVLGTADDIKEGTNLDTPIIDQQQTYTSFASHQVFLRAYDNVAGRPVPNGRLIDGAIPGNIANWGEVKAQAANRLGIALADIDVLSVPLLLTDPYGHFIPGPNGFPQVVFPGNVLVEGNPASPVSVAGSLKVGTGFLDDIAHAAVPSPSAPHDAALLNAHFVTGDGRGNENIALTMVHNLFHSEHNRVAADIDGLINSILTPAEVAAWRVDNAVSGWGYGERLFQAARFITEMEYSRIAIDTFVRKVQPAVNGFTGIKTNIDPAVTAEFSHASYRFGHSMLNERVGRTNADGSTNDIRLLDAFLNPLEYNNGGTAGPLTAAQAIGSIARGTSRQVGNEIDEFVTDVLRNELLGLPLDLPTINMTRGRSEGIPPLNEVRRQLFAATFLSALEPYPSWFEFGLALRHPESLVNFVAAYGTHPSVTGATTMAAKRAAAEILVAMPTADAFDFMFGILSWANINTGLEDVDLWVGGLAERPSPFGGLLGSTNNYIFETLMEHLQDADRLYYVPRVRGTNMFSLLEQNTIAEMVIRNSNVDDLPHDNFSFPPLTFKLANLGTSGPILDDPATPDNEALLLIRLPDGTVRYTGAEHVMFVGRNDNTLNRIWSSEGDDMVRGGAGVDIVEGGAGNDILIGGDGNDILTDEFGDNILMGGAGNDALSPGPGFGGSIVFGGAGKDFIVGSIDPVVVFAEDDDDIIRQADGGVAAVGKVLGGGGNDWIEGGAGNNELFGDCQTPLRIDHCLNGADVIFAGNANDVMTGEGGDDIAVHGPAKAVDLGRFGYDWSSFKNRPRSADADLNIAVFDPLEQQVLRDKFKEVEAVSGGTFNDIIRGDDRIFAGSVFVPSVPGMTCDPAPDQALVGGTFYCNELSAEGVARIAGLAGVLDGRTFPLADGNILLGGPGNDIIEGRGGNDVIDGDRWLNVQLRAPNPAVTGAFQLVNSMNALRPDVFAGRINPGDITIVRSIVSTGVSPGNVDTAVYCDVAANYTVTLNPNGSVTVAHNALTCPAPVDPQRAANVGDGTDTLWNIERLQFADATIGAPVPPFTALLTGNPPPASPPPAGTPVIFTAAATGGSGDYQFEFQASVDGVNFFIARDYAADPSWTWGTAPGTYSFRAIARNAGSTGPLATSAVLTYTIPAVGPATGVTLTGNPPPATPPPAGTPVTFTAAGAGGSGNYQYEFQASVDGVNFFIARDYAADPSWTWGTAPGTYHFRVNVRNAGSGGGAQATSAVLTYTISPAGPATGVTLAGSPPPATPPPAGTPVTFTATATGGSGDYRYEFQASFDGVNFFVARDYAPQSTWVWGTAPGTYSFRVNVRNAGSTAAAEATSAVLTYTIN